ncbi:B3 domain-containing protein [Hirschfeldia incana]|nr:B3 domain-containing protein [Hirschfeldia incana]KAJ0238051.1 B3 domain-containing protein [Hirschfeldia incana]
MTLDSVFDTLQENVEKPRFSKSLSLGENWKSKSVRMIPEEFVRRTNGAFEHRLVFSVSWGNSWQVWLQRDKNGLFMEEEDWDEFVDDNLLDPDAILIFTHVDTMFTEVRIYKKDSNFFRQVITAPLAAEPQTSSHKDTPSSAPPGFAPFASFSASAFASASSSASRARQSCSPVQNPEQYLLNPQNPYFVRTLPKKIDVLYVNQDVIQKYGLKFGPHMSPVDYLLPRERHEAVVKHYRNTPCINGWAAVCKKYNQKEGDSVVCELECDSGGVVTAVRVHFVNE